MTTEADSHTRRQPRPGGRSARVRSAVLAAAATLLAERGYDDLELPDVARRAGVHPTTVYRRWGAKARLVGEALLERSETLSPTPDTGALVSDLGRLLVDGAALVRNPAVRALFGVLIAEAADPNLELVAARDRFWAVHRIEAGGIVDRAIARGELPPGTEAAALIDLVVGPALLRSLLMGQHLTTSEIDQIVARAVSGLRVWAPS